MTRPSLALAALALLAGCGGPTGASGGQDAADSPGWTDLFDGETLDGWHGYARADAPAAWSVTDDGLLMMTPGSDDGGDLVAPGTYGDFELEVEWRIAECGNSGIFYRGAESEALAPIYRTAIEMQVLDDCHPDGAYPSHRNGSLYDLYTPTADASRPGWNTSRVRAEGNRIVQSLNGQTIVEAEVGSDEWDARLAVSKFRDAETFPDFGARPAGIVALQDHGDTLWVRTVRIRSL